MAKRAFLDARFLQHWHRSYSALGPERQAACDRAVLSLLKQLTTPGLRIKPILPDKFFIEARSTAGDRIIFRYEEGAVVFYDVVSHDDIGRYGRQRGSRG